MCASSSHTGPTCGSEEQPKRQQNAKPSGRTLAMAATLQRLDGRSTWLEVPDLRRQIVAAPQLHGGAGRRGAAAVVEAEPVVREREVAGADVARRPALRRAAVARLLLDGGAGAAWARGDGETEPAVLGAQREAAIADDDERPVLQHKT